jgi:hypothetical protein
VEGTIKKTVLSLIVFIFAIAPIASVQAQENASPSLSISPVIFEEDLNPGDIIQKKVTITNNSDVLQNIISEVADFYYDENGSMKFVEESDNNPATSSLKKWLSYETKEFSLNPRESKDVTFTISIPQNADTGGHYGVMFLRTKSNSDSAGSIGISSRVGVLVLVTIPGDVKRIGTVSDFKIGTLNEKNILSPQSFFEKGPIGFSFKVTNSGNSHFKPVGNITITDTFGKKVMEVPPQDTRSFPGTPRTYIQSATLDPWGWYTATLSLKDGDGNQMETLKVSFWGFDYKLVIQWIIIIFIVIIVLVFGIKQYNKWIIATAHKHHKK